MNSYRKYNGDWAVIVRDGHKAGDEVSVTLRDGRTKTALLAAQVGATDDGAPIFAVAKRERKIADIGNLSGVMTLFAKAKAHLKFPAIVLSIPAINETVRINVAGERAKVPGSLNIVSYTVFTPDGRRAWYGRVHPDGKFEQAQDTPPAVAERLVAFAADPAKIAAEHGKLTGRCCFCNTPLKDERSTAVGYGPICAGHFGLAWGDRPAGFAEGVAA